MPSCGPPWWSSGRKVWPALAWTPSPKPPPSTRRCSITTSRTRKRSTARSSTASSRPCRERIIAVCNQPGSAGHRFLSYARTHFDSVAESPYYAHIFMGELMSAGRGGSTHLDRIFAKYMKPIGGNVAGTDAGRHRQRRVPRRRSQPVPSVGDWLDRSLLPDRAVAGEVYARAVHAGAGDSEAPRRRARFHSRRTVRQSHGRHQARGANRGAAGRGVPQPDGQETEARQEARAGAANSAEAGVSCRILPTRSQRIPGWTAPFRISKPPSGS